MVDGLNPSRETLVAYNNRLGDDVCRNEDQDIAIIFSMLNISSIKLHVIDPLRQLSIRLIYAEALQQVLLFS